MRKIEYHPDNTRRCTKCKEEKLIDEFKKDKKASQGRGWVCIVCSRATARAFYARQTQDKKAMYHKGKQRATLRNQIWICKYLQNHPCVDCSQADIELLDFDHLGAATKVKDLCALVRGGYQVAMLEAEIAKCEVVCMYCHRKRTNRRGNNYRYRFALGQL